MEYTFRPHDNETAHENIFISKTLSQVETFENSTNDMQKNAV